MRPQLLIDQATSIEVESYNNRHDLPILDTYSLLAELMYAVISSPIALRRNVNLHAKESHFSNFTMFQTFIRSVYLYSFVDFH